MLLGTTACNSQAPTTTAEASKAGSPPASTVAPAIATPVVADLERIPVYPGSVVTSDETTIRSSILTFMAPSDIRKVTEFYNAALSEKGWQLLSSESSLGGYFWTDRTYLWTEQDDSPWHLRLKIRLDIRPMEGIEVHMLYSRSPDVERNLPVLPDAQQIEQMESEGSYDIAKDLKSAKEPRVVPAHIITKSFLTRASVAEIEQYYKSVMLNYWWFGDAKDTITSEEGLSFIGNPVNASNTKVGLYEPGNFQPADLLITTSPAEFGLTRVQLQAFLLEYILSPDGP
jgi:hypothetical protein